MALAVNSPSLKLKKISRKMFLLKTGLSKLEKSKPETFGT
jgi:hypothetical protein